MSSALAIASVSWVLRDLLNNAIMGDVIVNPVTVTVSAPDLSNKNNSEEPWLNLFLYNVTHNASWRNMGLPSRNQQGERVSNPPLALDLFYLLTAYGKKDFQTEILLGYAMQVLHENPVLPREVIRNSLSNNGIAGNILPKKLHSLSASDLADQFEMIKITPHQLSTEDISKLWTAFSTNYRPSVAYQVSVVLIERKKPVKSPLPVLKRGVIAQPSLKPPFPTLEDVKPPNQQIAVRMNEELTLHGYKLEGDSVSIRFTHLPSMRHLNLPAKKSTSDKVTVQLPTDLAAPGTVPKSPQDPEMWKAGVYRVALAISHAGKKDVVMTNELSILLAPKILSIRPKSQPIGKNRKIDLTENIVVNFSPNVWKGQNVSLIVGDCEIPAEEPIPFDENVDTLEFKSESIKHLKGSKQWVRLRVDGVESILIDRSKTPPEFDDTEEVEIT